MNAAARIAASLAALAVVFALAAVAGGALDPDVAESDGHGTESADAMGSDAMTAAGESLPGLASAQDGYRIVPGATTVERGATTRYEFTIVGPDGGAVTDYDVEHEREMHLIVVRRDLAGFQHLHPVLAADGTWAAEIDTSLPGSYRVFADFTTNGQSMTLATDLSVPGRFDPAPLPAPARSAGAGAGYEVRMRSAEASAGAMTPVEFTVSRDGRTIERVQPYLGADGHLVVLREGDLAFLHAHPQGEPGGSGPIVFDVDYPSDGTYRMFLQFRHRGTVHTAAFTTTVGDAGAQTTEVHNGGGDRHAH